MLFHEKWGLDCPLLCGHIRYRDCCIFKVCQYTLVLCYFLCFLEFGDPRERLEVSVLHERRHTLAAAAEARTQVLMEGVREGLLPG